MHPELSHQNNPDLVKYLKASTVAYNNAKSKEFLFSWVLFFLTIAYLLLYLFFKTNDYAKFILSIVSLFITIISWIIAGYFKGNTSKGALYKEKFDTLLYKLPWKFMLTPPDNVEVVKLANSYKGKVISDWYPNDISASIPKHTAIAICQRVSSGWDIELRTRYRAILIGICVVHPFCIFLLWSYFSTDGKLLFSIYFACMSFYTHLITLIRGNTGTINKRQKIVNKLDSYINDKKEFAIDNLRDVQDEIYSAREEPSKVPNSISRRFNANLKALFIDYVADINKTYDTHTAEL